MSETISQKIEKSPFKNIYWFARHLLNTDKYGAIGNAKEEKMLQACSVIENILVQDEMTEEDKLILCKATLASHISDMNKPGSKLASLAQNLISTLDEEMQTLDDVVIFCITMKYVVAPINHAMSAVPSSDNEFCVTTAENILNSFGEEKVALVLSTWDNMGVKGCLEIERAIVVEELGRLMDNIEEFKIEHTEIDIHLLVSAFIQEFERRLGQKRKARSGKSLESVASFLFDFYNFKSSSGPEHFNQDLEVDKWFRCKDGWYIAISCKRTLRERWKQVSQADRGTLSHFKVKELWHLTTYDKDLSDDKIVRLGEQSHIFYLSDNSDIYKRCSVHPGMKDYVRPLSRLIADIRSNMSTK